MRERRDTCMRVDPSSHSRNHSSGMNFLATIAAAIALSIPWNRPSLPDQQLCSGLGSLWLCWGHSGGETSSTVSTDITCHCACGDSNSSETHTSCSTAHSVVVSTPSHSIGGIVLCILRRMPFPLRSSLASRSTLTTCRILSARGGGSRTRL